MLLEWIGTKAPADVYPELPEQPAKRVQAFVRRNDEIEHGLREKEKVLVDRHFFEAGRRQGSHLQERPRDGDQFAGLRVDVLRFVGNLSGACRSLGWAGSGSGKNRCRSVRSCVHCGVAQRI